MLCPFAKQNGAFPPSHPNLDLSHLSPIGFLKTFMHENNAVCKVLSCDLFCIKREILTSFAIVAARKSIKLTHDEKKLTGHHWESGPMHACIFGSKSRGLDKIIIITRKVFVDKHKLFRRA
jgi:hypothetical protein